VRTGYDREKKNKIEKREATNEKENSPEDAIFSVAKTAVGPKISRETLIKTDGPKDPNESQECLLGDLRTANKRRKRSPPHIKREKESTRDMESILRSQETVIFNGIRVFMSQYSKSQGRNKRGGRPATYKESSCEGERGDKA